MTAEPPTENPEGEIAPDGYRRLFFFHVGTVVLTGAFVASLLLGVTSIPSWLSVAYCIVIATFATAFVVAAIKNSQDNRGKRVANRIECLALTLALSTVQALFVLPVLICIYMPTLRL